MSIWFYMFLITLAILLFFIIKVSIMKNEIKNIGNSFLNILKSEIEQLFDDSDEIIQMIKV